MDGKDKIVNQASYQCCFCGEKIISDQHDVTSLFVVTNWDKDATKRQEQFFFCHIKCLKLKLHKTAPLYLLDLVD